MSDAIHNEHKSRLFSFIFGREENKRWALSLYNAVNGTDYSNPDEVEITTMDDTIYMGMKNDLSFIVRCDLNLYEHQSTYNPNMPVRQLMYVGRLYDKYIKRTNQNIYGTKRLILPIPRLMTFYNGLSEQSDQILRLSDSFPNVSCSDESDIEVKVHMVNIRPHCNNHILNECKILSEYSWFIEEIRKNNETMELEEAVDRAIKEMPQEYELKALLVAHASEVRNMLITEYNETETMQLFKQEGREEGRTELLIRQICRKLQKGKTAAVIADELEEDEPRIKAICDSLVRFAPEYDEDAVVKGVHSLN